MDDFVEPVRRLVMEAKSLEEIRDGLLACTRRWIRPPSESHHAALTAAELRPLRVRDGR
jgi:hypothetical protein